jgi:hypothetical protein
MAVLSTAAVNYFKTGSKHLENRQIPDALAAYDLAERHGYSSNQCRAGRWMCWMLLGRFDLAWNESDLVAASGEPVLDSLWDGKPLSGRVMVRCLHGYGDTIQFIRYVPMLRRLAERVIVQAHPEMLPLLDGVSGVDELITWDKNGAASPAWDTQIEVMELPRAFATTLDTVPSLTPYISVPQNLINKSHRKIGNQPKPTIGIVWRASDYNPQRSIPYSLLLTAFEPAFAVFSLQHGIACRDYANLLDRYNVFDLAAHSPGIADTAADIVNLDLIITVDTLVAHLAGALAKPVWLLLPYAADWRWMLERRDSPWYPTMRIFRQPSPGAWRAVIDELRSALGSWRMRGAQSANP